MYSLCMQVPDPKNTIVLISELKTSFQYSLGFINVWTNNCRKTSLSTDLLVKALIS